MRLNRRYLLGLAGGLLHFFGARWAFQQGKPERLQDLTVKNDTLLSIHNGAAYFEVNEPLKAGVPYFDGEYLYYNPQRGARQLLG